ncbi:LuxR C-terminal-related transcriptional regulator [Paenibacillus thalictri]|uniref:Helix-turn-helix transcriptional regulator n=1 Tax=Paenibacillus thalictri TaxID=2527873 RepID=A0A4Q9DQ88_9BACL|nr:LuxR C-terminal-related transcriptional regulator [Paenibacillus thalictri]TBL76236.1 helix-turn-helix transcriptional regulator [Paenibacillus thalictri]
MNSHLLNEKFIPEKLPDICVPRPALLNTFHQYAQKRVILVSAPAGFGKTVSTLLWLAASGRKSIWISLDEYDNSPIVFYKLLCTGLLSASPDNKVIAELLRNPDFTVSPVEHTINFLSHLDFGSASYALVLDGTHLITDREIRKSLPYILKRLPLSLVTLLLTREEHTEYMESPISEGRAARITSGELIFSELEIQKYFKAYGHYITPEEALAVKDVTGGWAIGVHVVARNGQLEPGGKLDHSLYPYMRRHIWDPFDRDLQQFMLMTCVVDEMTAALANRLTGREDSEAHLDRLCAANSFVSRTDGGQHYRYYHIFLQFLRNVLEEDTSLDKDELYSSTAAYYRERGEYYSSIRFAVKAKDFEALTIDMLEMSEYSTQGGAVSARVAMQDLHLLGDSIPENFTENESYLLISQCWYYYLLGDAQRFCTYLDQLYAKLPEIMEQHKTFIRYGLFMRSIDFRRPIFSVSDLLTSEIIDVVVRSTSRATTLMNALPFIHRCHRDYSDFASDIEEKTRKAEPVFTVLLGRLNTYMAHALRAMLYYERNMLKEAKACCDLAVSILPREFVGEPSFSAALTQAIILSALGQKAEAEEKLAEVQAGVLEQNNSHLLPNFKAYETRVRLSDGDKHAASEWFEQYFVTPVKDLELYKITQHFTTARAYMVLAKSDEAMRYIIRLKKLGEDFQRPLDIAEADVLKAILEWALGKRQEAQHTLEFALSAAQEYGYVRIFAEEGAAVLPILRKISLKVEKKSYTGTLKAKYIHEVTFAAYEQSKRKKGLAIQLNPKAVRLSKQQKHILGLLAKGYKYKEIVEYTGLTIHTVKSHASAAYGKLDVNNSMDAVLKARELGLME